MTLEKIIDRHVSRQLDLFIKTAHIRAEVEMINRYTDSNK